MVNSKVSKTSGKFTASELGRADPEEYCKKFFDLRNSALIQPRTDLPRLGTINEFPTPPASTLGQINIYTDNVLDRLLEAAAANRRTGAHRPARQGPREGPRSAVHARIGHAGFRTEWLSAQGPTA